MFCSSCGNQINDGAKFCGKCGTAVSDTVTSLTAEVQQSSIKTSAVKYVGNILSKDKIDIILNKISIVFTIIGFYVYLHWFFFLWSDWGNWLSRIIIIFGGTFASISFYKKKNLFSRISVIASLVALIITFLDF